jgi:hypothetical protein
MNVKEFSMSKLNINDLSVVNLPEVVREVMSKILGGGRHPGNSGPGNGNHPGNNGPGNGNHPGNSGPGNGNHHPGWH